MASFADMTARLNLNIQNFASNMRRASALTTQFSNNLKGQINAGLVEPAKKSGVEFKDVARIVQGIIISKVFYSGLNSIRHCTSAVIEFSQELEYAKVAYSNLFGDTALAEEFINVLKDFAATTPFSFTESEAAAKRLLAYGIQYRNVMYVMQGVLAASSMQGNPQVIESVSRALGQIYTKGRLMNEEMRQLAEAGIPAYDILQQKLGLTQEQLQNLGREGIPASKAINALVDGINERFGGVVEASSKTLKGITSNIKDNATMIVAGAFEPVMAVVKSGLNVLGEFLFKLREIFELKGLGGVMEAIFPPELHNTIRQFVANFLEVHQAVIRLVGAVGGLLKPIMEALLRVYNAFAPVLTELINIFATIVHMITSNATAMKWLTATIAAAAAMWVVFKAKALATTVVTGAITLISKALTGLAAVLTMVAAHPFWALLIGLTGLVVGLSGGFGKLSDAINGYFKRLTSFNGIDPDKVLLPSQKERANDLNKFNEALDGTKDSMDDLADSTGKATKAAKGLLAFDEVFKLNKPDEGTGSGIDTDTDFDIPDLSGIGGNAFIPEIPDFSEFAKNFATKLLGDVEQALLATGIGATLGAILGGLIGGPLGAKIGAAVGGIAGFFWNKLADAFGLTPEEKAKAGITVGIGTGLGAIIGGILGGPAGAKVGAAIGALAGSIWGLIAQSIGLTDTQQYVSLAMAGITGFFAGLVKYISGSTVVTMINGAGKQVFAGFAHAVGASFKDSLKFGIMGAIANLATGLLANVLITWIAKELNLTDQDIKNGSTGQIIGNIIGSIAGMIIGGPMGSIIGGSIGSLAGSIVGLFWSKLSEGFANFGSGFMDTMNSFGEKISSLFETEVLQPIRDAISGGNILEIGANIILGILKGAVGAIEVLMALPLMLLKAVFNGICEAFGINSPAKAMEPIGIYIIRGIIKGIFDTVAELIDTLVGIGPDVINSIGDWFNTVYSKVSTWATETWNKVSTWANDTHRKITEWATNTKQSVLDWYNNTSQKFTDWYNNTSQKFTDWYNSTKQSIDSWYNSTKQKISDWTTNTKQNISDWWTNVKGKFDAFKSVSFTDWCNSSLRTIKDWASNVWSSIKTNIGNAVDKVKEFFDTDTTTSKKSTYYAPTYSRATLRGHASGGIFNREHIARFAEDNKAEAIVPLENAGAMQPFVDAVANGITSSLMPMLANISVGQSQLQPLYVGTLIADERSLKELSRKMQIIQIQEDTRRGR